MEDTDATMTDPGFWWEFVGKVGAPIFAATLIAFLLADEWRPLHGVLIGTGLGMMVVCHWRNHHREPRH